MTLRYLGPQLQAALAAPPVESGISQHVADTLRTRCGVVRLLDLMLLEWHTVAAVLDIDGQEEIRALVERLDLQPGDEYLPVD